MLFQPQPNYAGFFFLLFSYFEFCFLIPLNHVASIKLLLKFYQQEKYFSSLVENFYVLKTTHELVNRGFFPPTENIPLLSTQILFNFYFLGSFFLELIGSRLIGRD